jgi:hypothetical protein
MLNMAKKTTLRALAVGTWVCCAVAIGAIIDIAVDAANGGDSWVDMGLGTIGTLFLIGISCRVTYLARRQRKPADRSPT